jgi:hypothetical protein
VVVASLVVEGWFASGLLPPQATINNTIAEKSRVVIEVFILIGFVYDFAMQY